MDTKISVKTILALSVFVGAIFINFTMPPVQNPKWVVPDDAKAMVNPLEITDDDLEYAEEIYSKHCQSCHGKEGLGDGTKAAELDSPTGDFSMEEFQAQTDGELYYKTTEGRDEMPTFKKKIADDEDRWLLVYYLRTFAE
jgi:mono/diheme cytochrome c family protein